MYVISAVIGVYIGSALHITRMCYSLYGFNLQLNFPVFERFTSVTLYSVLLSLPYFGDPIFHEALNISLVADREWYRPTVIIIIIIIISCYYY